MSSAAPVRSMSEGRCARAYTRTGIRVTEHWQPWTEATDAKTSPDALVRAWPHAAPLAALRSGGDGPGRRWDLFAAPTAFRSLASADSDAGADAGASSAAASIRELLRPPTGAENARPAEPAPDARPSTDTHPPFGQGWIAVLSYELGRRFEPAVRHPAGPLDPRCAESPIPSAADDRAWPDAMLARIDAAVAHDTRTGRWWRRGTIPEASLAWRGAAAAVTEELRFGPPVTSLDASAHESAVSDIVSAIAAGEIFQANLTRRLTRPFRGSTRALLERALAAARPRYGALVELPGDRAVVSMSPELFLAVDSAGNVRSSPIKGTRPAGDPNAADVLRRSAKDTAELAMIVDLVRNDLGRVAAPGTVRVSEGRRIESHATVHHGAADVDAQLRADADVADLLAATFPPGSVTGAPKIRAMQVIDRHEPVRRGPYCGAIGWIGDDGTAQLNVAIRTIAITGERTDGRWDHMDGIVDYGAGGGIVADSDPVEERHEADAKTQVFDNLVRASTRPVTGAIPAQAASESVSASGP